MSVRQYEGENVGQTLFVDVLVEFRPAQNVPDLLDNGSDKYSESYVRAKIRARSGVDCRFSAALATTLASTTTFGTVPL